MKKFSALVLSLGTLAGCATIMEGQTQPITILTPGATRAECILSNKDLRYVVKPGETRTIKKSEYDLTIECHAEGNRKRIVIVDSQLEPAALANVTNAVVPGVTYDHLSRGLYAYPETITVDFSGVPASAYPLPDYMRPEVRNTYVGKIESYGPDHYEIPSDAANTPRSIQKQQGFNPVTGNPFEGQSSDTGSTSTAPAPLVPVTEK